MVGSGTKRYPLIAREARGTLTMIATVAILLQTFVGFSAALPAWIILAFGFYVSRDPTRIPPSLPLAIVSPIHGRVFSAHSSRDPWLNRPAEMVAIRGGLFDIRSIYSPTEGKIKEQWRESPNSPTIAYWIKTDEDDDIVLEIQRNRWPGPIHFRFNPGERVGQGRRFGYAKYGCIARLYFPAGSLVDCEVNQQVNAASDVVGTLVHLTQMSTPR